MIMRIVFVTTLLLSTGFASSAFASSFPCVAAVQNWQQGSATTCPYDSNGGGVPAPTVAPTIEVPIIEIPVERLPVDCASVTGTILPPVLRKTSVSDFAGGLEAPGDGCGE
jgi:hypothetical protein